LGGYRLPITGKLAAGQRIVAEALQSLQAHSDASALLTAATDYQSLYQLLPTVGSHGHY